MNASQLKAPIVIACFLFGTAILASQSTAIGATPLQQALLNMAQKASAQRAAALKALRNGPKAVAREQQHEGPRRNKPQESSKANPAENMNAAVGPVLAVTAVAGILIMARALYPELERLRKRQNN